MYIYTYIKGTEDERLANILENIKQWHEDNGGRSIGNLTWGMLKVKKDYIQNYMPKLKSKAIETRDLAKPLLALWKKFGFEGVHFEKVTRALEKSIECDEILSRHKRDWTLPANELIRFQDAMWDFVQLQDELSVAAGQRGLKLFNVTIKSHYLCHIALQCEHMSASQTWCYMPEDFMARMKKIASTCLVGNNVFGTSEKVTRHWMMGWHISITNDAEYFRR